MELIGTGILSWPSAERISGRYGCMNLRRDLNDDFFIKLKRNLSGRCGTLVAVVKETRSSGHVGDFFRGLRPSTPKIGERIELGTGTIFYDDHKTIGLRPGDGRGSDWLDPRKLYRLHDQTIKLYFVETEKAKKKKGAERC